MAIADTLLHDTCEWVVSCPRRLAVAIAVFAASPFIVEAML